MGTAITGSIVEAGDDEVYTFTGNAGQRILFDRLDNNFSNIYAQLESPSGISISNVYYSDSQPFTLAETGTYRLTLKSFNNSTGDYSFQLLDASAAPTVTLGTTVTNTLNPGLETDIYRINGTAGQRLYYDGLINNNTATIYSRLISPSGEQVFYNGDTDSDRSIFSIWSTLALTTI